MNVFLTGATGFIGQHAVRALLNRRHSVTCFVRDPNRIPETVRKRVRCIVGDETTLHDARFDSNRFDAVIHLAGNASLGNEAGLYRVNTALTEALIDRFKGARRLRRFIFTSTIGAVDRDPTDDCSRPLREESPQKPMSEYGRSKLACEQLLRNSSLPYVILRPGLVYGPGMRANSHLRVFIEGVRSRSLYTRFDFPGRLSFVHVDDVTAALLHTLHHRGVERRTFFVVGDAPVSIGSAFREIGNTFGLTAGKVRIPALFVWLGRRVRRFLPLQVQGLVSDVLWASNESLVKTGFRPRVVWPGGVLSTMMYHARENAGNGSGQAIVTGGAHGIGKAIAEQLACNGYDVIVADRDNRRGGAVAAAIGGRFVKCDLSTLAGQRRIGSVVWEPRTRVVVNNAGIGRKARLVEQRPSDLMAMISLNCIAPTFLTREALSAFSSHEGGTIINIGSSAGLQPLPSMSVYAASKAYVRSFTLGVQGETLGSGDSGRTEIILVSPSGTDTNFQSAAGVVRNPSERLLDPRVVARRVVSLIGHGHTSVTIGRSGKLMGLAARILPSRWQTIIWSRLMKAYR